MAANIDQLLKELSEYYAGAFIRQLFPGKKFRIVSAKLDKELTIKTRVTDRVVQIKTEEGDRLAHFEFQLRYRRSVPERMFVYAGGLTAKYKMEVASFLFLVKPSRTLGDVGVYRTSLLGKPANEFTFRVIHLWRLREAILSGDENYRIFAPLLLEIDPNPNAALLHKVQELIQREPDTQRREELYSFAIPLASRHFGLKIIKSILTEPTMTDIKWEQLPYIGDRLRAKKKEAWQEGKQEGLQEGRQEGRQEGGLSGMQEMLLEVLNSRFGNVSSRTVRAIHTVQSPSKLKTLARKSLKAESLAEVQKLLPASKPKPNGRRATSNGKSQRVSK